MGSKHVITLLLGSMLLVGCSEETQNKMALGQAILVDVRSKASYDKSHAEGAISIPEAEMGARVDELPRDKDIILYCT